MPNTPSKSSLQVISAEKIACHGASEGGGIAHPDRTVDAIVATLRNGDTRVSCLQLIQEGYGRCLGDNSSVNNVEDLPLCPFYHNKQELKQLYGRCLADSSSDGKIDLDNEDLYKAEREKREREERMEIESKLDKWD